MRIKLSAAIFALIISGTSIVYLRQHSPATDAASPVAEPPVVQDVPKSETEWVTLKLPTPKPVFAGTPRYLKLTKDMHLDPKERALYPNGYALVSTCLMDRGELHVPKGTELISLRRPVSLSDNDPIIGHAGLITDGSIEGFDGDWVELPNGLQWVQVDLGTQAELWGVCIWHDYWPRSIYRDVIVMTADDPGFTKNVRTLFNNDHDNSAKLGIGKDFEYLESGDGKLIQAHHIRARYVRCYSAGNTSDPYNRWLEICVYGQRTSIVGR